MTITVKNGAGVDQTVQTIDDLTALLPPALGASGGLKVEAGASEAHVGEVGGNADAISPAIVVQTGTYTTGQCIGGKLTLANLLRAAGRTSMLGSSMLRTKITNTVEMQALIFRADPTASTFTDKIAAVLHADDVSKVVRVIQFNAWISPLGVASFSQVDNLNRVVSLTSGVDGYAALIAKGSITFASTSDVSFAISNHRN